MEDSRRRSGHGHRGFNIEEDHKRVDSIGDDKEEKNISAKIGNKRPFEDDEADHQYSSAKDKHLIPSCSKQESALTAAEGSSMGHDSRGSSSNQKEKEDQLESARMKMDEVKEENQRLKMYLDRIMRDYQTLQTQFYDIVRQESKNSIDMSAHEDWDQENEEPDHLVSLSLGRFSSDPSKNKNENKSKNASASDHGMEEDKKVKEELSLGLDYKYEGSKLDANESLPLNRSPTNSFEESKEEAGETWPPSKALKIARSGDDELLPQNTVKKTRVSVRARCDTPTMNDGCQWRKYGQKIAKGNPCPRAYYRCTVAPSCPVRKQVQRCADDMSILITTYEGTHNHPLPVSATAMASTTSAAASMLLSGSSSSTSHLTPSATAATVPPSLRGLNFYLSDNSSRPKQFYLPNTALSSSLPYQTITLDLTTPSSASHFNRFSTSNYAPNLRYNVPSSTSLNFSSSSESNSPMHWGNGLFTYNSSQTSYVKNHLGNSNLGRVQPIENIYQSYMQKSNPNPNSNPNPLQRQQSLPADTIAAATKAITADPTFQSALAAAITSIIGTGNGGGSGPAAVGGGNSGQVVGGDNYAQKLVKWGSEQLSVGSSYSSQGLKSNTNGCASSYLNRSSSTTTATTNNPQPAGNLILSLPSVNTLAFSNSKSASDSPNGNRELNN